MASKKDIDQMFRLYYKPMCLYAVRYTLNEDAAEDIVQEAFVALWQKIVSGSMPMNTKAYLAASVRNKSIDYLRHKAARGEEQLQEKAVMAADEVREMEDASDRAALWRALDALPAGRRRMLLMHKRDGLKYAEIAQRLGVSEGTVRNQISRALQTLRGRIKKIVLYFFV